MSIRLFIANWKMQKTVQESLQFVNNNLEKLSKLKHKLIIAPTAPALTALHQLLKETDVALCGQNCSEFKTGPYTGQVSAQDLVESGCNYVLVGHSEERAASKLTNEQVVEKTLRIFEAGMIPVVCIGEPQEIRDAGTTQEYLEEQLYLIKRAIQGAPLYIAYEPLWAIGSGKTPTNQELAKIFDTLKLFMQGCAFLYGGSVNQDTVQELKKLEQICGFLIGNASLEFETLYRLLQE